MPVLKANSDGRHAQVPFTPGATVRKILETTDCRVHAGCSGNGACGLCRVRARGDANPPTQVEEIHFGKVGLASRLRLACQMVPTGDIEIDVLNPAPDHSLRVLDKQDFFLPPRCPAKPSWAKRPLGVAVDVGTTNVTLALWDLSRGERLTGRSVSNRQACFGADVLTRIKEACESDSRALDLQRLILETIGVALNDALLCEGRKPGEIARLILAGNTAQLSLLSRKNTHLLLDPVWWDQAVECVPNDIADLLAAWGLAIDTQVDVLPPLAGWVGSDALAGVLATEMTSCHAPSLLIDIGTNSEIALWDGRHLWMTSAAGGPAFEGCGLSCGMAALPGAVYAVEVDDLDNTWRVRTIADTPARGVCGSGFVDIVTVLRRWGRLDEAGRFSANIDQGRLCLDMVAEGIGLSKPDVDVFQRAKAAIATGVYLLRKESGCLSQPIKHLFVCGAFGKFLNVVNAQRIGLLPQMDPGRVTLCGNTSVAGCELLLESPARRDEYSTLQSGATLVNMCGFEEFDEHFMMNLFLEPYL